MPKSPPPSPPPVGGTALALRAQILATEHWSLLASRTTTQNEVLSRIGIFLTLVSATLVSLALIGQATHFGSVFPMFAIAILAFTSIVGLLTQLRVSNASMEDMGYVLAMNRLRATYAELVPGVEEAFMTSAHDDKAGIFTTYYFLGHRRNGIQFLASSTIFIVAVNGALLGLLAAAVVTSATSSTLAAVIAGGLLTLIYIGLSVYIDARPFFAFWKTHSPRNPSR